MSNKDEPKIKLDNIIHLKINNDKPEPNIKEIFKNANINAVCLADVEPQTQEWLWYPFFPKGSLTVLASQAGMGKSRLLAYIAAHITNGALLPTHQELTCEPGHILIFDSEQDCSRTIRTIYEASGVDLRYIHFIKSTVTPNMRNRERLFSLKDDIDTLKKICKQITDIRMVIFDPITSYLGNNIKLNASEDIRRVISPLADIAEKNNVPVILITHMNKDGKSFDFMERILGSGAFGQLARSVVGLVKHPEEDQLKLLISAKCNLIPEKDKWAIPYIIEEATFITKYGKFTQGITKIAGEPIFDLTANQCIKAEFNKLYSQDSPFTNSKSQNEFIDLFNSTDKPLKESDVIYSIQSNRQNDPSFKRGDKEYERIRARFNRFKSTVDLEEKYNRFYLKGKFKFKIGKGGELAWIKIF